MTRPVFTILFFFSLLGSAQAQQLNHFWTKFIGGDKFDMAYDAVATPDGGIAFTGQTRSNGTGDIPLSAFGTDTFVNLIVGKIDSHKQLSWIKVYGGSKQDIGYNICNTSDGGLAVLGTTASPDGNVTGFRGARDLWLLKLNASGDLLWQKTYGSSNSGSLATDLIETRDGGFMLMGSINGAGDDIPVHYGGSPFVSDWFLLKTDSYGNKQWSKTLGGNGHEEHIGSIIEINDGYYLIGSSESRDHDCIDTAWHVGVDTKFDFYVLRLGSSGNIIWQRSFGGSSYEGPARGILDIRDSSIVLSGPANSSDYMVNKTYIASVTWLMKADKTGGLKWAKILGNSIFPQGDGILPFRDGYIVTTQTEDNDIGLYVTDIGGNKLGEKKITGMGVDAPYSLISYGKMAALIGVSSSPQFTTGTNLNSANGSDDVFISGVDYWPTNVATLDKWNGVLTIFPNPTKGTITMTLPEALKLKGWLTVHDGNGLIVYKRKARLSTNSIAVETDQWPPGVYMVQWQDEDGQTATAKFIRN